MQAHLYYSEQELGTAVVAAALLGQQVGFFVAILLRITSLMCG